MHNISIEEKKMLKASGIINQKQSAYYVVRFLSKVGYFRSEELIALAEIAKTYGNGEVALTSRLTIEIPYIKEADIEKVKIAAEQKGLRIGGAGKTVRAILACKGEVCKHSMVNTRELGEKLEDRFVGDAVPAKFKIGIFGCANSTGKAESNDFGIMPVKGDHVGEIAFSVFLGGRSGKKSRKATPLSQNFAKEDLELLLATTIAYYNELAIEQERLAEVMERIGVTHFEQGLLARFEQRKNKK